MNQPCTSCSLSCRKDTIIGAGKSKRPQDWTLLAFREDMGWGGHPACGYSCPGGGAWYGRTENAALLKPPGVAPHTCSSF